MNSQFLLLMLACSLGTSAYAQTLGRTMAQAQSDLQGNKKAPQTTKAIRLNPSNRFNVAPQDVYNYQKANAKATPKAKAAPAKARKNAAKIAAATEYPDSINLYGVLDPTYGIDVEGLSLHHAYSFQAGPGLALHQTMNDAELPEATTYVRKGDEWYCFESSQITVVSALTGEVVRKAAFTDATVRRAGGTYDPSDNCFYIGTWDGLFKVNADDLTYTNIGDFPAYLMSIAAGPDALYEICWPGKLYKVDKATGETTVVSEKVYARSYANQGQSSAVDYATNMLYISYMDNKWNAHVDKYDLNTNTPIEGFDFAAGGSTMMGLYIPAAEAGAPAAPTGIAYADGKLHFNAPSKTYSSGETLSGELTAYITVDKVEKTFTVTAGEAASLDLPLADGDHEIYVQVGNAAGRSQERVTRPYVGQDVPSAVDSLTLNTDDGKNMSLSWTAPKATVHGGPVDDANVNYRVVRMPDEVVVAEGLKDTKFSEPIPETHLRYYYEVTAYNGEAQGATAQSNIVPAGAVWVPPYTEEFPTQEDFDFFTVIDGNNDGQTWKHMHPNNDDTLASAYLNGNGVDNAETGTVATYDDDYLVTPSIRLKKGNDYRLKFNDGDHWMSIETMEILLGTSTDTTSVIKKVTPTFNLYGHDSEYTFIFNVPEDGLYNLFFHANTVGNSVNIVLDNISVDVYSNFEGPDSVQQLTAKAGALGALENTITFNAPTKSYQQGALSEISYINVYRNGGIQPVHVFEKPTPGELLSWTDTGVEQGSVTYRVVAFNEKGQGREALVTNWVGIDVPANPTGAKAVMNDNNQAVVTWEKVGDVGIHGGYVNPDDVKYVLYRYNEYNYMDHWEAVTDSTTGFTLTDETYSSWYYQQEYVDYVVRAINSAGSDYGATVGIVLGEAYERPYKESFPGGEPSLTPWTLYADSYNYAWTNVTGSGLSVKPYDGDEGMLKFSYLSEESNKQVIAGPRISLKDAVSPELSFYMYHGFEAEPEDLVLDLYANYQDEGWSIVKQVPYNNGADGWARYSLPLRTDAKDVQFAFAATAVDASASIYIDALKVDESVEKDLTVQSFSTTKRVEKGETGTATVTVANYGTTTADAYTVVLLKDGVKVDSKQGENLAQNEVKTFTFALPTTKADASKNLAYQAVAVWTDDSDASNDSSAVANMYVHGSVLPKVESLAGEGSNSNVTLTWKAPATNETPDAVTDDFDSYEDFIIDKIGDWTTYDADGMSTAYFGGPEIAHVYEPKAWQVWDPEAAGFSLAKFDVLTPHSGEQYLACWAAADETGYATGKQDDWLISPEVLGGSDLSFYYRVPNSGSDAQIFEIMYSESGKDAADFVRLDRDSVEGTTNWVHFEYTVPETAKYFAIRNVSKGSYTVAFLDDVTYTPLYGATTELTLKSYNIYRDNELIATVEAGVTSYNDAVADASNHEYHVTAVWDAGESNYSNGYTYDYATGIAKPSATGLFTAKGGNHCLTVANAKGTVNVYNLAGQTVAKVKADGSAVIPLPAGVYMVNAGSQAVKVVVK